MRKMSQRTLTIAAVGDISFAGANVDKPTVDVFKSVQSIFAEADIIIANLEGPLYDGYRAVPGKCTIRANSGWADVLKTVGIDIVTLANNHIMDHGNDGLFSTLSVLDRKGIAHVGAGANLEKACKPFFVQINEYRLAFLARTSVIVNSPSYADGDNPGVAFLDMEELVNNVKACRNQADVVVVLMHWGIEEYSYPTPDQRKQAKRLIKAGVDLVIGHHPHVVQGYERFGSGIAAYSLGNFVFDEFEWMVKSNDGTTRKIGVHLTPENRKGIILTVTMADNQTKVVPVFTQIENNGRVSEDTAFQRAKDFEQLCSRLRKKFDAYYAWWWKLYSLKIEWKLRFGHRLAFKNIIAKSWKFRPRHIRELIRMIRNSLRISFGRSTNPYE